MTDTTTSKKPRFATTRSNGRTASGPSQALVLPKLDPGSGTRSRRLRMAGTDNLVPVAQSGRSAWLVTVVAPLSSSGRAGGTGRRRGPEPCPPLLGLWAWLAGDGVAPRGAAAFSNAYIPTTEGSRRKGTVAGDTRLLSPCAGPACDAKRLIAKRLISVAECHQRAVRHVPSLGLLLDLAAASCARGATLTASRALPGYERFSNRGVLVYCQ